MNDLYIAATVDNSDYSDSIYRSSLHRPCYNIRLKNPSDVNDILVSSSPSDYFIWDQHSSDVVGDVLERLGILQVDADSLIRYVEKGKVTVPGDLLIGNTVPLRDILIKVYVYTTVDDNGEDVELLRIGGKDSIFYIRMLVHEQKIYITMHDDVHKTTSTVIAELNDDNRLSVDESAIYAELDNRYRSILTPFKNFTMRAAKTALLYWYGICILMLNPEIKEHGFKRSKKERKPNTAYLLHTAKDTNRKRKSRYIRYTMVTDDIFNSKHSPFVRKTLCWYVIGHYRHYKSGKKVWINGYWKGPLRSAKSNLDDGRQRII